MNFIEYHGLIQVILKEMKYSSQYLRGNSDYSHNATNLKELRRTIKKMEVIPYLDNEIAKLKTSWLYESTGDAQKINSMQNSVIEDAIQILKIKLSVLKEIAEQSKLFNSTETILIKISEINSFDSLQRYANDFKKAIETPILEESINGTVTILSADEGSIIFYLSLGTAAAVELVAAICWAAAVIKKKRAEAEIFEQHARTLSLKNDALANIVQAQKAQLKNILDGEAQAIADKKYKHNDPETIERLKLSISTVESLIDKGVQILPVSGDKSIRDQFPDYKNLHLVESSIKKIAPSE